MRRLLILAVFIGLSQAACRIEIVKEVEFVEKTENVCKTVEKEECQLVNHPICHPVVENNCQSTLQTQCTVVRTTQCQTVPVTEHVEKTEEVCHDEVETVCTQPEPHCETVHETTHKEVTEEVCTDKVETVCEQQVGIFRQLIRILNIIFFLSNITDGIINPNNITIDITNVKLNLE